MMSKLPSTSVSLSEVSLAVGKPAPVIDLVPLTDSVSLSTLNQVPLGKVTLLHFWGTWCGPCKMEYPELAAMVRRWEPSTGFQFISVSCESGGSETFDQLKRNTIDYFESSGVNSVAYCDPRTTTRRSVADRFERDSMFFPTTILIGPDGLIVRAWEGFSEAGVEQMHQAIKYLLRP